MVAQFLFLLMLFAVGLLCLAPMRSRVGIALACLLAFPLGSTVWVLLSVAVLVAGLPYTRLVMQVAMGAVVLTAVVLVLRAGRPRGRELATAAVATALFAGASALAVSHNYSFCSDDSWQLMLLGKAIGQSGGLTPAVVGWVYSYGIFVPALQAAAALYGFDYLYAHTPVLSLCLVANFAALTFQALRSCHLSLRLALAGAALGSGLLAVNYFYVFQSFFLLANLTAGVNLLLGVALLCRYLREQKVEWLALGTLFLCCFSLSRVETSFLALLVWIGLLGFPQVRLSSLAWCYGGYTLVVGAWFFAALSAGGWAHSHILSARLFIGIVLALAAIWVGMALHAKPIARIRGIRWMMERFPDVALYLLAGAVSILVILRPEHAATSASNMLANACTSVGNWGVTWIAVLALAILASWLRPWHGHRLLVTTITGSLLMIYLASFFRSPYRLGWGDSGNRMLLYLFPSICFYLVTRYGCSLAELGSRRQGVHSPAARG